MTSRTRKAASLHRLHERLILNECIESTDVLYFRTETSQSGVTLVPVVLCRRFCKTACGILEDDRGCNNNSTCTKSLIGAPQILKGPDEDQKLPRDRSRSCNRTAAKTRAPLALVGRVPLKTTAVSCPTALMHQTCCSPGGAPGTCSHLHMNTTRWLHCCCTNLQHLHVRGASRNVRRQKVMTARAILPMYLPCMGSARLPDRRLYGYDIHPLSYERCQ